VTCHATRWRPWQWKGTGLVKRLLNFDTRFEVHALLSQFRVPYRYSQADAEQDVAGHRELGILPPR
jgi:hypothetical protein